MKIKLDENFDRRLAPLLENPFRFPPEDTEGIIVVRPPRAVLPAIRATLLSILPQLRSQSLKACLQSLLRNLFRFSSWTSVG